MLAIQHLTFYITFPLSDAGVGMGKEAVYVSERGQRTRSIPGDPYTGCPDRH